MTPTSKFRRVSIVGMTVGVIAAVALIGAAAAEEMRNITADLVMTVELTGDDVVSFRDVSGFGVHRSLACALPYGDEGVVVYDSIENKVTFFGRDGRRLWATGQVGDGPEDHREPCELYVLGDGRIALASLSPPVKVVFYGNDGLYLGHRTIHGVHGSPRIVFSLLNIYAVKPEYNYEENVRDETDWTFSLVAIDDSGIPFASQILKRVSTPRRFRPGRVVKEQDLWFTPRIETGPRGTVLVQADVYEPDVDVYDPDLNRIARIEGGWTPPAQSEEYRQALLEKTNGAEIAADTERALPHLFCFDNREIWLQKQVPEGGPIFATYDVSGASHGFVYITGIDASTESMALLDTRLLTFEEFEDGVGGARRQLFRVYRLDG
ncbi:MAG: hypothetical protein R3D98_09595 [Candidatus Krumholzibacteriia bacterium]